MQIETYEVQCVCGAVVRSATQETRCGSCGQLMRIEWGADYRPKPDRCGTLPTLAEEAL